MPKTKTKRKILITASIIVALIVVVAIFYFVNLGGNESQQKNPPQEQNTNSSQNKPESTDSITGQEGTSDPPGASVVEGVNYSITNLNKKDGDVFSTPDEVTFTITPSVEITKISIKNSQGTVLYFEEQAMSQGRFIVYLGPRATEGETGTILLEGFKEGKVVASKEIRIVF